MQDCTTGMSTCTMYTIRNQNFCPFCCTDLFVTGRQSLTLGNAHERQIDCFPFPQFVTDIHVVTFFSLYRIRQRATYLQLSINARRSLRNKSDQCASRVISHVVTKMWRTACKSKVNAVHTLQVRSNGKMNVSV